MKKAILIGGGIFAALAVAGVTAIVILLLLVGGGDRYSVTQRGNVTLRTDRFSGKTEMLAKDSSGKLVWTPVVEESQQTRAEADAAARRSADFTLKFEAEQAALRKAECDRQKQEDAEYLRQWGVQPPTRAYSYLCPK